MNVPRTSRQEIFLSQKGSAPEASLSEKKGRMDPQAVEDERVSNITGTPFSSQQEEIEAIESAIAEADYDEEKMAAILEGIQVSIESENVLELKIYLGELVIQKSMPMDDFQRLFSAIMDFCVLSPNLEVIQAVTGKFMSDSPDEDSLYFNLLSKVYLWDDIKIDHLRLLKKAYPSVQRPLFIVERFLKYRDDVKLLRALARIDEVFERQSRDVYAKIFGLATEAENRVILDWVKEKIASDPERVPKPSWVRNFTDAPVAATYPIPEPPVFTYQLPSPEEAAVLILNGFGQRNLKIPENAKVLEAFAKAYAEAPEERKIEMVADNIRGEYMARLAEDETYFRLLGPRHPMADFRSDNYNHPCLKYGGCPMHGCNHEPDLSEGQIPDFNAPVPDYFTGVCDNCLRQIPYRIWAVREPLLEGSWSGCYCSFNCIEEAQDKRIGDQTVIPQQRVLLEKVMADMERIGIQDRTSNAPILEWPEFTGEIHPPGDVPIDISSVPEVSI